MPGPHPDRLVPPLVLSLARQTLPRVKILIFALDPRTFPSSPKEQAPPRLNFAILLRQIFKLQHLCPFRLVLHWKGPVIDKPLNSVR